ncbi:MAG: acetate--CoA ligase, partial [Proteobacteria bacterium]|nr:acetate--CoA ligase [Pseudomonadota bacterium]
MTLKSVSPLISTSSKSFDEAYAEFEWQLPSHFNIAESVCDRHLDLANRIAMLYENERGE